MTSLGCEDLDHRRPGCVIVPRVQSQRSPRPGCWSAWSGDKWSPARLVDMRRYMKAHGGSRAATSMGGTSHNRRSPATHAQLLSPRVKSWTRHRVMSGYQSRKLDYPSCGECRAARTQAAGGLDPATEHSVEIMHSHQFNRTLISTRYQLPA